MLSKQESLMYVCIDCEDDYTIYEMSDDNGSRCNECEHNFQTGFNDEDLFI